MVAKGPTGVITREGLVVKRSELEQVFGKDGVRRLLNKFTIRYPSIVGTYIIKKTIYISDDKNIFLPRFAASNLLKSGVLGDINVDIHSGEYIDINYTGTPTHNQKAVSDHIMNNYFNEESVHKGLGGVTVFMQAGSGKTYLAMYLLSKIKRKTLIVVPNTYLLTQWVDCLREYTSANIGVYYGKKKVDGDIVVAIINSLVQETLLIEKQPVETHEFFQRFGMVVLDESHMYSSDSFRKIYNIAQCPYMLAMSATPNEKEHGLDKISHYNVGPLLDARSTLGYIQDDFIFSCEVEIVKYNGPSEYTQTILNEKTKMACVASMMDNLIADNYRNTLIINKINEMIEKGMNIFVFTDRRSHAELLADMLVSDNVVMYGGSDEKSIQLAKGISRVVITTYSYSSTGISIDRMTACILATPRKSHATQIIGRIFRRNDKYNKYNRMIVDIVDNRSILKSQLSKRMIAYKERDAIIRETIVNYNMLVTI